MKQILSLALALLPCLALAQYPSNGNQKITLGEQTTADGLIFRGVLADTGIITPSSDTSAYIILDTVNHRFYNYNRATNVWSVAGGGTSVTTFSAGSTGLTPSTATSGAVTLGGTLAVANGGTNTSTAFTTGSVVFAGTSGTYTQDNSNLFFDNTNNRLGIGTASPNYKLDLVSSTDASLFQITSTASANNTALRMGIDGNNTFINATGGSSGTLQLRTYGSTRATLDTDGNVGIGTASPNNLLALYSASSEIYTQWVQSGTGTSSTDGLRIGLDASSNGIINLNEGTALITSVNDSERMRITNGGEVYVAGSTDQGAYNLQVNGTGVWGAGAYVNGSDANIKENIEDLDSSLYLINNLKPVTYKYKESFNKDESTQVGFIAQDVYQNFENKKYVNGIISSDGDILSMSYSALIPILTKAIQEQTIIIKQLEERIKKLEER